ncbi:MAG: hypothetical protein RLZZ361_72 [Cyanobacteriota bacterium]
MVRPATNKSVTGNSFASELSALQANASEDKTAIPQDLTQEEQLVDPNTFKPISHTRPKNTLGIMEANSDEISEKLKMKLKEMRDKEEFVEQARHNNFEESNRLAEEIADKYSKSETTMATAAQDNNKIVTEAFREGNVAQEQTTYYDSNDRKKQLAKWDELAPRIIEDPKNRAVRIDIPGLNDVETLIVRMKQDSVFVQIVGDKSTMERLQSSESELSRKLRDHNVKLAGLQVFDSGAVTRGAH